MLLYRLHLTRHLLGDMSLPPAVLYADVASPMFKDFHQTLSALVKEGQISYRVRYRPPQHWSARPLFVSGYGVELALKRTDYIVIDDRDAGQKEPSNGEANKAGDIEGDAPDDLRPLSSSEVSRLGVNTVSYVMDSANPLDTLVKLSQDFPKYSAKIAAHNATTKLLQDIRSSRLGMLPSGVNVMWINGVQMDPRKIDAYSLLDHLRRERKLIEKFRDLGISAQEAVDLLSHKLLGESLEQDAPQRYNYRDETEGGKVLIWLNDLEKDAKYDSWPSELGASLSSNKIASPDKTSFQAAIKERKVRADRSALSLEEVLKHEELDEIVSRTVNYQNRLRITGGSSLIFINGVPIVRDDNWVQEMSNRVGKDLQSLQQGIMDNAFEEDAWLPKFFLSQAFDRRNPWVIPEDPKDIRVVDLAKVSASQKGGLGVLPRIASNKDNALDSVHMIVVGDFDSESGTKLLTAALESRQKHDEVEILFLHNPAHVPTASGSIAVYQLLKESQNVDVTQVLADIGSSGVSLPAHKEAEIARFWALQQPLAGELGFAPGASGVVINGRAVGPIPNDYTVVPDDFDQLLRYELTKRIGPVSEAAKELEIDSKLSGPLAFAKLTSLATLSTISDVPEGIFESTPDVRMNLFDKWNDSHSVVTVSNSEDAAITIVASIDPTSEVAQRWLPILKVLSELASVRLRLFLNAREEIQELPIKRFYRYVLDPEPSFAGDGAVLRPGASFSGVPVEALLTLGMDVPSSWLVAPQDSVHDLDNIKLSTLKAGSDVDAIYALEHILIEGHSRDLTTKTPPRGVQLALGTQENPYFSDTIIMANLGYFQFKAQPGLWQINLKPGRSERIFKLDSVGGMGYAPQLGDENNEVALLSFQGKTLFPRLSRKKGHESEDVLDTNPKPGSAMDYVSKGLNFASGILSSVGAGSKLSTTEKQADINIFSVASGHLYERMLNIMMVSVMRNTKHSVKFWFIEQFLSPSFKSFLPHLAKEYGFSYEMVTFKWPHWLRAQREKQREIWGYKILFLDVLFPLSLDKVIFVDADQVVRTDMYDLVNLDLEGAPYGFTPMCDSRHEMEGFRFWKQGYWKNFLRGQPYHISALYVVDLSRFRALAAGDRLRGQYQMLSADPNSLSNLDQDLPNHMQHQIPIKSLPQEWLWCETWCSDESLGQARTIDLCNNPQTKEPKLDRARRQVPEWTEYDEEIAALVEKVALEQQQSEEAQPDDEGDEDDGVWTKDEL
ncbi:unnamed protein product [Aspergillus oryzae]|uniref:Unnamed protein product n=1 Tax=Aspergillus oryzae TaxID=5062 RepID=A0AAN4YLI1_ASPOZ|nr:unnamed protein product [Aspergillus oryzae]GMF89607.1 unnamed protein product [Aspergillus oryzae]GMG30127.1 unnamed protein product [Aspergillus oryzae]